MTKRKENPILEMSPTISFKYCEGPSAVVNQTKGVKTRTSTTKNANADKAD